MDNTPPSPTSSSSSDSDAFNTESARLYFGPVKTPERKFMANNIRLFPPSVSSSLRRSPRLSSPRRHPPTVLSTVDIENSGEEAEDIELVARLVNQVEVDGDEDMSDSAIGTPQRVEELEQDEPLSALADKILHAIDNPSPPPSPPNALTTFDLSNTEISDEPDAMSLDVLERVVVQDKEPHSHTDHSSRAPWESSPQPDLISFDSPKEPLAFNHTRPSRIRWPNASVDDLLLKSPEFSLSHASVATRESTSTDGIQGVDLMSVDGPKVSMDDRFLMPDSHEPGGLQTIIPRNTQIIAPEEEFTTPLRRSSRPRRSILPASSPKPITPVSTTSASVAHTSFKKNDVSRKLDEDFNTQDQQEDGRRSPSRPLPSTPRGRQRSPSKEPLSFRRELGSLSPTSTNVLSTLAFNITEDSTPPENSSQSRIPFEPPPVFSFSVFASSPEVPSTPVPFDGPKRVPSPTKVEVSPEKFRLRSPAPNDPTNTPARRIPIERAIAQGQLSPEKAAQMGFKAAVCTATPSTSLLTPARRVLTSEKHHPLSGIKSTASKFGTPAKQFGVQKERLTEPTISSVKGKEKAVSSIPQDVSSSSNLPYPITTSLARTSSSQGQGAGHTMAVSGRSPAKSNLKQVTSKIPRINKKPYARKMLEKPASGAATAKPADSTRSLPKSLPSGNVPTVKRPIRLVETSTSRIKPTVSTTATLLKRKREVEKSSPPKPRMTTLRQVLPLSTPIQLSTDIQRQKTDKETVLSLPATDDQQVRDTIDVQRMVSLPLVPKPLSPSPQPLDPLLPDPSYNDMIIHNPRRPVVDLSLTSSLDDLPPGSPMKQDPSQAPQSELNLTTDTSDSVSLPGVRELPPEVVSSGLRRTTRARKPVNPPVTLPELGHRKVTRRKANNHQSDDVFSGMSITALKELTMTNTVKNQHYLAAKLETEVVRKEGFRPESPVVKIRTVLQRQQEEKERQRAERARRRARRSGNDEESLSDIEISTDVGYSSPCEDQSEDVDMERNHSADELAKHRRGAGDEEDYETPDRPLRNVTKRPFDDGSEEQPTQTDRRVKWDRGLFTFVYLDDVKLGSRQNLKENSTLKGILAPGAKALCLDTLGNLLHGDAPLTDLVPENVTVKKFVYDNDVVVPEPPAPKTTRSKSKRK